MFSLLSGTIYRMHLPHNIFWASHIVPHVYIVRSSSRPSISRSFFSFFDNRSIDLYVNSDDSSIIWYSSVAFIIHLLHCLVLAASNITTCLPSEWMSFPSINNAHHLSGKKLSMGKENLYSAHISSPRQIKAYVVLIHYHWHD